MQPKKDPTPTYIKIALIGLIPLCFLAMHMGIAMHALKSKSILTGLVYGFMSLVRQPLGIKPFCEEQTTCLSLMLVLYFICWMFVIIRARINHVETKDTDGSNHWLSPAEVNGLLEKCQDKPPKIKKKKGETLTPEEEELIYDIDENGQKKKKKLADSNIIYSQRVSLGMDQSSANDNNSSLTFGGAGSWKTTAFVLPNVCVNYGSAVVLDPSGEVFKKTAAIKKEQGYEIRVLNISDMSHSDYYNPLEYLHESDDLNKLVTSLIENTDGGEEASKHKGDDFWNKAERNILSAAIAYTKWEQTNHNKMHYFSVYELLRTAKQELDNKKQNEPSTFDKLFECVKERSSTSIAAMYYDNYATGTDKTKASVMTSVLTRLNFIISPKTRNVLSKDTLEIDQLGLRKQILYIINRPTNSAYRWLTNILLTQIMDELLICGERHTKPGTECRCPVPVKLILEEGGSCGTLPNISSFQANCRKYGISVHWILQDISQLRENYGQEQANDIIANSYVKQILSCRDNETAEYFSKMLGYRTIIKRGRQHSITRGGTSYNDTPTQRALAQPAELQALKKTDCVLIVGSNRIYDKKFNLYQSQYQPLLLEAVKHYQDYLPNSSTQIDDSVIDENRRAAATDDVRGGNAFSKNEDAKSKIDRYNGIEVHDAQFVASSGAYAAGNKKAPIEEDKSEETRNYELDPFSDTW